MIKQLKPVHATLRWKKGQKVTVDKFVFFLRLCLYLVLLLFVPFFFYIIQMRKAFYSFQVLVTSGQFFCIDFKFDGYIPSKKNDHFSNTNFTLNVTNLDLSN